MPNHRASSSSSIRLKLSHDGELLNKLSVPCEAAPLYAPWGVEMGGGGPPQNLIDTAAWPESVKADSQC